MRIHTDKLTETDIRNAMPEGVAVGRITFHGSRKRATGIELNLTGHGKTGGQWGNTGDKPTASWDDWGIVLANLYAVDPGMVAGPYEDFEHFTWVTSGEYGDLEMADAHHYHKWTVETVVTGSYNVSTCKKCGRHMRYLNWGQTWAQFTASN